MCDRTVFYVFLAYYIFYSEEYDPDHVVDPTHFGLTAKPRRCEKWPSPVFARMPAIDFGTAMNDASLTVSLMIDLPDAWLAQRTRRVWMPARERSRAIGSVPVLGMEGEPITFSILAVALIICSTTTAVIKRFQASFSRKHPLNQAQASRPHAG